MSAALARQLGLDVRSPTSAELQANAVRVNGTLIATPRHYGTSELASAATRLENALFTDGGPENPAWRDGDEFAWFVAARDRLGQPGEVSRAGFGFVCAKLPPPPPGGLEIENVFQKGPGGSTRQLLRLRWPLGADGTGHRATRYHIYRGQGAQPTVATGEPPASQRLAVMDAPPGVARVEWIDLSLDAAANPALFGQGYWYALRAERGTPCGPVVSDLAPAVVACLHRLDPPYPPGGGLLIRCPGVEVASKPTPTFEPTPDAAPDTLNYTVVVERQDPGVAWAEIAVSLVGTAFQTNSPQLRFGEDDHTVRFELPIPTSLAPIPQLLVSVVAGGFSGAVSSPATTLLQGAPPASQRRLEFFQAATLSGTETLADRTPQCPHIAFPPGDAAVHPVRVRLQLTPRTRQWRVFRQLDDAPLTLIAQGLDDYQTGAPDRVIANDDAMPQEGARLCYYGQVADEDANWSSLASLGCVDVPPRALPVPMLAPPAAEGTSAAPVMRLKWFCPPGGVRDFLVLLKPIAGPPPSKATNTVYPDPQNKAAAWGGLISATATPATLLLPTSYVTDSVGTNPPAIGSGPEFTLPIEIDASVTYEVRVAARDARGLAGHPSWTQRFTWQTPRAPSVRDVPWPDRTLPPVLPTDPRMQATLLQANTNLVWPASSNQAPVGILIGSVPVSTYDPNLPLTQSYARTPLGGVLFFPAAPLTRGFEPWLFGDSLSRPPRPEFKPLEVVLYRQQQTNDLYPVVSGRVVQTAPLFRKVAGRPVGANGADGYELLDPFLSAAIRVAGPNEPGPRGWIDLYLLDTHPVVRGARYRYWLTHFGSNGEPDQTLPAGEVEVTP
jgi:hypothetical protein